MASKAVEYRTLDEQAARDERRDVAAWIGVPEAAVTLSMTRAYRAEQQRAIDAAIDAYEEDERW